MNDDNVEHFASQLREMMEKFDLPYLKISIQDIDTSYTDSEITDSKTPLTVLSSKIEALVNALLWDTMATRMPEAGFLLSQLEDQVDSLMSLSGYLRLIHDKKINGGKGGKQPKRKPVGKKVPKPEPLPKIFSDTLKEILDEKTP